MYILKWMKKSFTNRVDFEIVLYNATVSDCLEKDVKRNQNTKRKIEEKVVNFLH